MTALEWPNGGSLSTVMQEIRLLGTPISYIVLYNSKGKMRPIVPTTQKLLQGHMSIFCQLCSHCVSNMQASSQ